jgi:hypothetical protein
MSTGIAREHRVSVTSAFGSRYKATASEDVTLDTDACVIVHCKCIQDIVHVVHSTYYVMWNNKIILMRMYFLLLIRYQHLTLRSTKVIKIPRKLTEEWNPLFWLKIEYKFCEVMESFCAPIWNQNQNKQFPFVAIATLLTIVINS